MDLLNGYLKLFGAHCLALGGLVGNLRLFCLGYNLSYEVGMKQILILYESEIQFFDFEYNASIKKLHKSAV